MLCMFIHDRMSMEEGPMAETITLQKSEVLVLKGCAQGQSRTKMAASPLTHTFSPLQNTQVRHGTYPHKPSQL